MNRVIVLAFSFALARVVETIDSGYQAYYLFSMLSCLILIKACSLFKDRIIIGYALIQISVMFCYFLMLIESTQDFAYKVLYTSNLNLSYITTSYEVFMLLSVGGNCVVHIINRAVNAMRSDMHSNQMFKGLEK